MRFLLARIQPRRRSQSPAQQLLDDYLARISRYQPVDLREFPAEDSLATYIEAATARTRPHLVLTDPRGQQLTSEAFAVHLRSFTDSGVQQIILAIGPPDGWSPAFLRRAHLTLAFGRMTFPHELAAVLLAEQTYRALTILAGHPYHSGH